MLAIPVHTSACYGAPPESTLEALIDRLEKLLALDQDLHVTGNTIHKDDAIYEVEILPGLQFFQALYEDNHGLGRDLKLSLLLAIDRSVSAELSDLAGQNILAAIGPWSENKNRGVGNLEDWIQLLRQNLNLFNVDIETFFKYCVQAFPNFKFSSKFPECLGTFKGYFQDFTPEIVNALVSLSDDMPVCMEQPTTKKCMQAFSAMSGYDTSLEGNADRKDSFTFDFISENNEKKVTHRILCEPHMKLHRSARAGDTVYYFHRIYFSSSPHTEFPEKTLIGHIGEHL